ncbi:MAG: hypothetical protein GF309_03090 [Candidatus Lokiarchaeota archaeon]|nr:hypothetical protein [Candidatus Lokiarchaeota archaeon]
MIDYEDIFSDLNEESREALISRAEQIVLDRELDRLTEEIVATRQALQLENADKMLLGTRARTLATRLKNIRKKRKSLANVDIKLRIEILIEAVRKTSQTRLEIPPASRRNKDSETLSTYDITKMDSSTIKQHLKQEVETLEQCIHRMANAIQNLRNEETELRARYDIDSLARFHYFRQRDEIRREIEILEICREIAEQSIAQANEVLP